MSVWQKLKDIFVPPAIEGPVPTEAQTDAAFIALQARKLEEAIGLVDTGTMSNRRDPSGARVQSRQAVLDVDQQLTAQRIRRLEWVLRSECSPSGQGCRHSRNYHHAAAEAGVAALFPKGAFSS